MFKVFYASFTTRRSHLKDNGVGRNRTAANSRCDESELPELSEPSDEVDENAEQ